MPICGVIDPSHSERKRATGGSTGALPQWYSLEYILETALYADPRWSPWSYELLNAAISELQDRGEHISTTALVSPCPRSTVLERKVEYVESVDRLWRAFRGTAIHKVLEDAQRPGSIAEVRFFTDTADGVLSCKPDLITSDGTIWDYKTTANMPRYDSPYASAAEQLQINRYIVNHATRWEPYGDAYQLPFDVHTLRFKHLAILYMDQDGPKSLECMASRDVPTQAGARNRTKRERHPDVWTDEKVMGIVGPRYRALKIALESYPEWPAGLEQVWGGGAGWACPGRPWCMLKGGCLAARYPNGMKWENN